MSVFLLGLKPILFFLHFTHKKTPLNNFLAESKIQNSLYLDLIKKNAIASMEFN